MNDPIDRTTEIVNMPSQGGQSNVPGIRRFWLVEARHVKGILDPRTVPGALYAGWILPEGGLQLSDDAQLYDWRFAASRGSYEEKAVTTVHGIQYEQMLRLVVPKDSPDTTFALMQMAGRKWMVIYTDSNGLLRLVGKPRQPLRFGHSLAIGTNERVLQWSGFTKLPSICLNSADALSLSALIAYQSDFSRL